MFVLLVSWNFNLSGRPWPDYIPNSGLNEILNK